jgi:tripartite-type tricarboxylate transporter receptor subunit TctC
LLVCCSLSPYPAKPVRIVVPAAPGGTIDIFARAIGQKLGEALGQPVIVENRAGGGTNIGNEAVAKAAPDGYTLLMGGVTIATNPSLYASLAYDPAKDLVPVSILVASGNVLIVNPAVAATSVRELVALAKAQPGRLNFGSPSTGSTPHLAGELFKSIAGVDIVHVPYKGAAPALTDLMAGQLQIGFDNIPPALPHIQSGKLRALAVTSARRSALLPDLPTMGEAGLPGFDVSAWFGLFAPAGTPPEIVTRVQAEAVRALRSPEVRERIAALGFDPLGMTTEESAAYVKAETARWAKIIKASGARAD